MKKKIIEVVLLLIGIFSISNVYAFSNDSTLDTKYIDGVWAFHYRNGKVFTYGNLPFRYVNGKLGYCIDPPTPINTHTYSSTNDFSISGYDENTKKQMELIAYYGYEYEGHQDVKYYMAAQELIWLFSEDERIKWTKENYSASEEIDITKEKNEIINLVNNHNKLPSFSNTSYTGLYDDNIELIDTNNVINNYEINSNLNYKVEGNILKININKFGTNNLELNQKKYNSFNTTVYYSENVRSQKIAVFGLSTTNKTNIVINSNKVKAKITKYDLDNNNIIDKSNIKFKLTNIETGEVKNISLEKGELIFEIEKGNYILEETNAPYGYVLNKEKNNIKIDDNITLENGLLNINCYNKKSNGKIIINKIDEYSNNIEGVKIGIYNDKYKLIEEIVTTKDGNNESKILPLGKYYVREIETVDGYMLDDNYYEVNLKYKNQNTSVVESDIELINKQIKCDITYITNVQDVEINVYDSNNKIVFNGKTDKDGKVVLKNLPYGKYYIKQIKVPSGYILNDEEYVFYVNDSTCLSTIKVENEKTSMPITSMSVNEYFILSISLMGIGLFNLVKKNN